MLKMWAMGSERTGRGCSHEKEVCEDGPMIGGFLAWSFDEHAGVCESLSNRGTHPDVIEPGRLRCRDE